MTLLSSADLEMMRAAQEQAMPDTITIVHPTLSADGQGGYTASACTSASYTGRVSLARGTEEIAPGQFRTVWHPKLTLPHDATVSASDLAYAGGLKYRVLFVDSAKSWSTAVRADMERMS